MDQVMAYLGKLQDEIWKLAKTAASRDGRPKAATLVLPALNEMFDRCWAPPPTALLLLDWGATTTTNRNVQAFCIASSAYPMQMSYAACELTNNGIVWGVSWTTWADYPSWLPLYVVVPFSSPAGQKPVMVALAQFKDAAGNITQVQASIQLKPPPLGHLGLLLLN